MDTTGTMASSVLELGLNTGNNGRFAPQKVERISGSNVDVKDEKTSSIKSPSGGWKMASLLLVNQGLITLAFFGVGVNLVLFLIRVLEYDNATAANTISRWTGTVYLFSLIGAFLSDSYWGRYLTCAIFQVIFITPEGCGDGELVCKLASPIGSRIFYLSIYLVALGYGGHQPTIATLGADQFSEADPLESQSKAMFFSYFYFALNAGSLFSNTVLVYFEDSGHWTAGFWASAGAALLGFLLFLIGTKWYRHFKPCGNPLTRVAQVFVAAGKKWRVTVPTDGDKLYELQGSESAIKGSRKIYHSDNFRVLDKAATLTQKEMTDPSKQNTWSHLHTDGFPIREQGDVMNSNIGSFHLPAASMSAFDVMSVLIFTFVYNQLLVPVTGRFTGNPKGISQLQRMGIGLLIGVVAMLAAGATEIHRLKYVDLKGETSSLSIFWQIPQYMLVGASEVFMYVGQLEFFNSQAPDGLKSFGSSLCMASISLGNYASSMLVSMVMSITAKGDSPGWIPGNLNTGHIDRFYFLIAGLTVVDFIVYLFCAKWYKCINVEDQKTPEIEENVEDILSRV
ncbi:hypothetical protein Syun_017818 [Stephania yunnanensis]|uniref:Uncharacterized protein n=1 Tax=Stephania yunnanensis TaxID=152371 RepID=A0AAP0J7R1_9MAGN